MSIDVIEKPYVDCTCGWKLRPRSMRKHVQTMFHKVRSKHRELLNSGWTDETWSDQHSHDVRRTVWLTAVKGQHTMMAETGYKAAGWGHREGTYAQYYTRVSLKDLYYSPQITDAEFEKCCNLPESDPEYQALWTLARLGGQHG